MSETLILSKSSSVKEQYETIIPQVKAIIDGESNLIANLANISAILKTAFSTFSWVGFYIRENNELILGPFQGEIACTRIELGKGVCGTSASTLESIIVPDVDLFEGHIACSSKTRSEIVIPLISNELCELVLDVDSEIEDNFNETDQIYLEQIVDIIKKNHFI